MKNRPKRVESTRNHVCFADIFTQCDNAQRLSIYAFPHGNIREGIASNKCYYGFSTEGPILPNFGTEEKSGAELWAEFLGSFVPGTSYMEVYDEIPSIHGKDVPMCEFRFEEPKEKVVSRIMRQCWINGVRYCYESGLTRAAEFCLSYWEKEMKPYQTFQLYLLSNSLLYEGLLYGGAHHRTYAQNPHFCNEDKYKELLTEARNDDTGTGRLSRGSPHNQRSYNIKKSKTDKIVEKAEKSIKEKTERVPLKEILKVWEAEEK